MTTFIFILIAAVLLLGGVCFFLIRALRQQKEKNKSLLDAIDRQKSNIDLLMQHIEKLKKIQDQTAATTEEIQNAETDEDINNIIAGIIAANNNRV